MQYYIVLTIIVWLALIVLSVLVFENHRIKKDEKRVLYITYLLTALAATAELLGLLFNGHSSIPSWVIKLVKFFDYALTPIAGGIIVLQFKKSLKLFTYIIFGLLAFNILFQFVSLFTDWMIVIDNANNYAHGKLYLIYIIIYFAIVALVIVEFALHGRKFRRHNRVSLFGILIFLVTGITLQIFTDVRCAYVTLTLALALLFIHHSEFSQQEADYKIQEQKILITIDPLTGILNRYAYEKDLSRLVDKEDLVIFSIDINNLKSANDTKGHAAGDELICGAAKLIRDTFNKYGKSYRTGGDEFIVISYMNKNDIEGALKEFKENMSKWSGDRIDNISLSIGYASREEFKEYTIDELVGEADKRMYKNKADFHALADTTSQKK
jgi:diguanylate cyclase (GGDEF)-like protein